jgi:CheY-like chemotaxis protein
MEEKEIVLVDDDKLQYMLVKSVLNKIDSKIKITFFRNPEDALIYLQENEEAKLPTLILLDLNMPEMTGWEFLEQYTNYEHKSKVVILSSSIDANDITKANIHPDVLEFCSKPLYVDKMNEIINCYTC